MQVVGAMMVLNGSTDSRTLTSMQFFILSQAELSVSLTFIRSNKTNNDLVILEGKAEYK